MENLVRKNLSSEILGAPMKNHSEAVGQATHSLPSLAPEASLSEGERRSRQNKKSNKNRKREQNDDSHKLLRSPKMVVNQRGGGGLSKTDSSLYRI